MLFDLNFKVVYKGIVPLMASSYLQNSYA